MLKFDKISEVQVDKQEWLYMFHTTEGPNILWTLPKVKIGMTDQKLHERFSSYSNHNVISNIIAIQCSFPAQRERAMKAYFKHVLKWKPTDGLEYFDKSYDEVLHYFNFFATADEEQILKNKHQYHKLFGSVPVFGQAKIETQATLTPVTPKQTNKKVQKDISLVEKYLIPVTSQLLEEQFIKCVQRCMETDTDILSVYNFMDQLIITELKNTIFQTSSSHYCVWKDGDTNKIIEKDKYAIQYMMKLSTVIETSEPIKNILTLYSQHYGKQLQSFLLCCLSNYHSNDESDDDSEPNSSQKQQLLINKLIQKCKHTNSVILVLKNLNNPDTVKKIGISVMKFVFHIDSVMN
jgi:hypothetical protein